ncbi:hypothetical protein RI129_001077 [Pyrocoelia pectoralis]|uniref:DDE Tnp4 domain-containing protein n=1 Tax=Pyrocoelia pectoralis TaxID=417401 RepID=A0AAN7ZWP5_9COLE
MDQTEKLFVLSSAALVVAAGVLSLRKKRIQQKRKRRCWVRSWLANSNFEKGNMNLIHEFEEPTMYLNYVRMNETTFEKLLKLIQKDIEKKDTNMRQSISARHQLIVTLRFLVTGNTYRSLMYNFRISESTISLFIPKVSRAIYKNLQKEYIKCPNTTSEWLNVANDFNQLWNFPNGIAAMDGKHVTFRAPSTAGSMFYNYKGQHSIVLLALVDAHYNFLYVDVGTNGRISDGGVFRKSTLCEAITDNKINIPKNSALPGRNKEVPFVIVADAAFPLATNILKPYPFRNMLSRARRVVENAFGILANRFRVLLTIIHLNPDKVQDITLTCCALHNFLSK